MSKFLDVPYSENGAVLGLRDRTFIVAILILSSGPEGPGFKLTSPASRSKIANLKDGREGGSENNFRLKHTFKRGNFALTELENMMFLMYKWHCCYEKSEYEKRRHDFRDGSVFKKCVDWRRLQCNLGYLRRGWLCLLNVYGLIVSCLYAAYDI